MISKVYGKWDFYFQKFSNEEQQKKMLGVTIDKKLNGKSHIKALNNKASQKIGELSMLSK